MRIMVANGSEVTCNRKLISKREVCEINQINGIFALVRPDSEKRMFLLMILKAEVMCDSLGFSAALLLL